MISWVCVLCFFSSRRRHTRLQGDWSSDVCSSDLSAPWRPAISAARSLPSAMSAIIRSEEHTSELQSPCNLVCRLLLEKKNFSRQALHSRRLRRARAHVDRERAFRLGPRRVDRRQLSYFFFLGNRRPGNPPSFPNRRPSR